MARVSTLFFPGLILLTWLSILVLRLMPIGGDWENISASTWGILINWMLVYFAAMICGGLGFIRQTSIRNITPAPIHYLSPWITRLSIISILGALLIVYEFAYVRGYGFFNSVATIRVMEVQTSKEGFGGSWISGMGRLMTPALMTAWVIAVLIWQTVPKSKKCYLIAASITVFIQQFLYEGGRFYYAALLTMMLVALKFKAIPAPVKRNSNNKHFLIALLCLLVVAGFGYVFVNRIQASGRDFYEAYSTWAKVFDLAQNDASLQAKLSGPDAAFWLALMMLWAYITQGINELDVLLTSEFDSQAYGLFQFTQIGQVLAKLFNPDLKFDRFANLPHTGTYFTLYGASYVDFGHLGAMLFSGILGWLTGRSIKHLRMHKFSGLALNAPLLITLGFFAPVVSLITNLWPAFFWTFFIYFFRFRLFGVTFLGKNSKHVIS